MEWIEELAVSFGIDPLGPHEITDLLDAARDVAHGVERKVTPVATYLVGMAVQRKLAEGRPHGEALAEALADLRRSIPA